MIRLRILPLTLSPVWAILVTGLGAAGCTSFLSWMDMLPQPWPKPFPLLYTGLHIKALVITAEHRPSPIPVLPLALPAPALLTSFAATLGTAVLWTLRRRPTSAILDPSID